MLLSLAPLTDEKTELRETLALATTHVYLLQSMSS